MKYFILLITSIFMAILAGWDVFENVKERKKEKQE